MSKKRRSKGKSGLFQKSSEAELFKGKTQYFGTTYGPHFWRRYKKGLLKDRGYCEIWLTRKGLYFRFYFTLEPVFIPIRSISEISYGFGHAGRPSAKVVLKVHWNHKGEELVSGFASIKDPKQLMQWERLIRKVMKG
jgi:hypothetical protein